MFRDMLSSKVIMGAFVFCCLIVGGSLLYSWHVERGIKADEARTQRFLQQIETNKKRPHSTPRTENTDTDLGGRPEMPVAIEGGAEKVAEEPDSERLGDVNGTLDVADAFLPDKRREEELAEDVPVSPYGFGPYPELPEGWSSFTFPARSANHELMKRIRIKLLSQGINAEGTTMENGLVYPVIKGIAYVKWKEYERPTGIVRYISRFKGHPEDGARMNAIRFKKERSLTEADVPSDIKLVSFEEGGIDPYQFLNLP